MLYLKYFASFQFIEKLDSGKYKLHSKNHEMHEEYDFLIWAGHPFDLPKLMYPCDMKNYLFDLFKTLESNYVTASFLSMKNSIRGAPVQVYANQFNSDTFENTPMVDVDFHGFVVSSPNLNVISIYFTASCFESGPMPTPTK